MVVVVWSLVIAWASVPRAQVVAVFVTLSGQAVVTNSQGGCVSWLGRLAGVSGKCSLLRGACYA
jgi:hypothetical protein